MGQGLRGVKAKGDAKRAVGRGARKPPKAKVQAKRLVAKKAPKRKGSKERESERRLAEALEREKAIGEILRLISISPGDVQPVLEAVAERAAHLCEAPYSNVWIREGDTLRPSAFSRLPERTSVSPVPLTRGSVNGRAVLDRKIIHHADIVPFLGTEYPDGRQNLQRLGIRAHLAVPLLREGEACGTVTVFRREPRPFSPEQIALVKTFADQAVIAIQNVRLFNETKEALERQTATSEILRVISRSPTDVQPVFDAIAERAATLCGAKFAFVTTFDGEWIHLRATYGPGTEEHRALYPVRPGRGSGAARIVQDRAPVQIPDFFADADYAHKDGARRMGIRSGFGAPMMRNGQVLGAIMVARPETGLIPEKLLSLLQTFADQAVIAIENVRLFTELEARTAQLTRSVAELKALGEVGQAVSSTLDLETVLSTIVSRAVQLAGMDGGSIWEYDEIREEFYLHATDRLPDELVEMLRSAPIQPIQRGEGALGRLVITGEPVQIRDIAEEPGYPIRLREILTRSGYRSVLAVPLLREDHLLGALAVNRTNPGHFGPEVVELLKTFATQSALAIQNARLFREVEVKSRELEAASRHKSEFLANMSHELRTPLNAIIGFSEVLSERMFGEINEKQAEYVGDILQSGQHLLSLINDILDLSKIEAGRMELELSEFDFPGAIENTMILVRERAVRRGIALGRSIDQRLSTIRADERKVKQVLLNLLSNALKFTSEGGRIDVRAAVNDCAAEVSVTDSGVGIAPEDQATVFEEFRQVGTASKKVEGTGLGLAISRKFIELHGGRIWVKSQIGTGSTFTFTLPLR